MRLCMYTLIIVFLDIVLRGVVSIHEQLEYFVFYQLTQ